MGPEPLLAAAAPLQPLPMSQLDWAWPGWGELQEPPLPTLQRSGEEEGKELSPSTEQSHAPLCGGGEYPLLGPGPGPGLGSLHRYPLPSPWQWGWGQGEEEGEQYPPVWSRTPSPPKVRVTIWGQAASHRAPPPHPSVVREKQGKEYPSGA